MHIHAVVPLKNLAYAKSRLAGRLNPTQRRRLVREMLERVLAKLLLCRSESLLAAVSLVSSDPEAQALALALGVTLLPERAGGLNAALEGARATLTAAGEPAMLVVPGDVPLITQRDVRGMVDLLASGADVVLAPDAAGCGTNALALRLPSALPLQFGIDSALLHRCSAARLSLQLREYRSATLALDIDTAENLEHYRNLVPALQPLCSRVE
jgi:2-phospho-L-lactate/phosphoenolpyruvate guanylyltransferase